MKSVEQKVHLHIYHAPAHKTGRQLLTQKNVDIALVIVSFAGLISAMAFFLTLR